MALTQQQQQEVYNAVARRDIGKKYTTYGWTPEQVNLLTKTTAGTPYYSSYYTKNLEKYGVAPSVLMKETTQVSTPVQTQIQTQQQPQGSLLSQVQKFGDQRLIYTSPQPRQSIAPSSQDVWQSIAPSSQDVLLGQTSVRGTSYDVYQKPSGETFLGGQATGPMSVWKPEPTPTTPTPTPTTFGVPIRMASTVSGIAQQTIKAGGELFLGRFAKPAGEVIKGQAKQIAEVGPYKYTFGMTKKEQEQDLTKVDRANLEAEKLETKWADKISGEEFTGTEEEYNQYLQDYSIAQPIMQQGEEAYTRLTTPTGVIPKLEATKIGGILSGPIQPEKPKTLTPIDWATYGALKLPGALEKGFKYIGKIAYRGAEKTTGLISGGLRVLGATSEEVSSLIPTSPLGIGLLAAAGPVLSSSTLVVPSTVGFGVMQSKDIFKAGLTPEQRIAKGVVGGGLFFAPAGKYVKEARTAKALKALEETQWLGRVVVYKDKGVLSYIAKRETPRFRQELEVPLLRYYPRGERGGVTFEPVDLPIRYSPRVSTYDIKKGKQTTDFLDLTGRTIKEKPGVKDIFDMPGLQIGQKTSVTFGRMGARPIAKMEIKKSMFPTGKVKLTPGEYPKPFDQSYSLILKRVKGKTLVEQGKPTKAYLTPSGEIKFTGTPEAKMTFIEKNIADVYKDFGKEFFGGIRVERVKPEEIIGYHGTTDINLRSIKKSGLKPGELKEVYLAPTEEGAMGFAMGKALKARMAGLEAKPVVLKVKIPKEEATKLSVPRATSVGGMEELTLKEIPSKYISIGGRPLVVSRARTTKQLPFTSVPIPKVTFVKPSLRPLFLGVPSSAYAGRGVYERTTGEAVRVPTISSLSLVPRTVTEIKIKEPTLIPRATTTQVVKPFQIVSPREIQMPVQKQEIKVKQAMIPREAVINIPAEKLIPRQAMIPRQALLERQALRQLQKLRLVQVPKVPQVPKITIPRIKIPTFEPPTTKKLSQLKPIIKAPSTSFLVYTRERKQPKLISPKPLSLGEAKALGVKVVSRTPRASFQLVPTKAKPTTLGLKPLTTKQVYASGYRPQIIHGKIRQNDLVFVQKKGKRMSNIMETKSIQAYRKKYGGFL